MSTAEFRVKAEQGDAQAQTALGKILVEGRDTRPDYEEANLAQRYQHGQGIATNLAEAYKWFALAAKQGLPDAAKECRQLKPELSSAQIAEGDRFAASFTAKPTIPRP